MKPLAMTVAQVAAVLQCSEGRVRRLARDGVLRRLPTGGRLWRFATVEVEAFLCGTVSSGSEAVTPSHGMTTAPAAGGSSQPIPEPPLIGRRRGGGVSSPVVVPGPWSAV